MNGLPSADRLGRWLNRRLSLLCPACGWSAAPLVSLLAAEMLPCTTLAEAAARLRCGECGVRPEALGLVDAPAVSASVS